jgi:hypothetical protein
MVMVDLSQPLIDAGRALVEELDKRNEEVDAAFWFLFSDTRDWKLVLSLPAAIKKGPRESYKAVQKAMQKLNVTAFGLDRVAIARLDTHLIKLMRTAVRTGKSLSGIRFTNNVINGVVIEDAYIYRLM